MNKHERAMQIFPLLIFAARKGVRVTYKELSTATGIATIGLGRCLGVIKDVCDENNFPPLTAIVVSTVTGESSYSEHEEERTAKINSVYNYYWDVARVMVEEILKKENEND